jgi:hypothetical protein
VRFQCQCQQTRSMWGADVGGRRGTGQPQGRQGMGTDGKNRCKPFGIRWKHGNCYVLSRSHGWSRTKQDGAGTKQDGAGTGAESSRTEQDGLTMNLWHANTRYFPVTSDWPRSENEPLFQGPRSSILAEIEKHRLGKIDGKYRLFTLPVDLPWDTLSRRPS